jgi:trimeric autotransporter adhesin
MKRSLLFLPLLAAGSIRYLARTEAGYIPPVTSVALQQYLTAPAAVAYDPAGNLYYATPMQVWRWNADGSASLIAGAVSVGTGQSGGDGGPAVSALFVNITALAADAHQNIYIADSQGCAIRRVAPDGSISTFAGTGQCPAAGSNAGPGVTAVQVQISPAGLAIDSAGTVYASDQVGAAVVAFSGDGQTTRVIAGNQGPGAGGDGGPAAKASLNQPGALARSGVMLFLVDTGNLAIRQINLQTGIINSVIGQPGAPFSTGLGLGAGLAVAADGSPLLQGFHSVWKVNPQSGSSQLVAGGAAYGLAGDGGPATAAAMEDPAALAVNPVNGDLAIADDLTHTVRVVSAASGKIQAVAGQPHFAGDTGPARLALFDGAQCLVMDGAGNLLLADANNNRVRSISPAGVITTIAGTGISGYSGDGGQATAAQLALAPADSPLGSCLAVDGSGNLFIDDAGNGVIRRIDAKGTITTVAGGGAAPPSAGASAAGVAIRPTSIAVSGGSLYFGETGQIFEVDSSGNLVMVAGDGTIESTGDGGPAGTAHVGVISCMAGDGAGNLYFCDALTSVVRRIDTQNTIGAMAGNGTWTANGVTPGPATASPLGALVALAVDSGGRLYIGTNNSSQTSQIAMVDSTGELSALTAALPVMVTGLAVAGAGNLHVADAGTIIRRLTRVDTALPR